MTESLGSESLEPLKIQGKPPGPITVFSDQEQLDPTGEARGSLAPQSRPRRPALRFSDASPAASLRREIALWCSDKMQEVCEIIQQATNIDVTVLISGETGTGKDLVARATGRAGRDSQDAGADALESRESRHAPEHQLSVTALQDEGRRPRSHPSDPWPQRLG